MGMQNDQNEMERPESHDEIDYKWLFGNLPVGIARATIKGEFIECNPRFEEIIGYSSQEIAGTHFNDITPQKWHDLENKVINEKLFVCGDSGFYEKEYITKFGRIVPIKIRIWLKYDENNQPSSAWGAIIDLTDIKKIENELKRSENRMRKLLLANPDMIFIVNRDGVYEDFFPSPSLEPMLQPSDFLGRSIPDILPKPIANKQMDYIQNTLDRKQIHTFEFQIDRDGGRSYYETRFIPLDHNKVLAIARDITARKEAEIQLWLEKDRNQQYLDIAGIMLLVIDKYELITLINKKGAKILGYSQSELIGKNWFDTCIPEQNREDVRNYFRNLFENPPIKPDFYENYIIRKNGEKRLIHWTNTIIKNSEGEFVGALSSGEDVSEIKEKEQKIVASEQKFRNLVEKSTAAIILLNMQGVVVETNAAIKQVFGISRNEVLGKKFLEFHIIAEDLIDKIWRKFISFMNKGGSDTLSIEITRQNGETGYVNLIVSKININGEKMLQIIANDITEHRMVEEKIAESEELFRKMFETSHDLMLIVDLDFDIKWRNSTFTRISGYTKQELTQLLDKIHPEDRPIVNKRLKYLEYGNVNQITGLELRFQNILGNYIHLEASITKFDSKKESLLLISFHDITDKKESYLQIKKSEHRYRALFESSYDGIALMNLEGIIQEVNTALCNLLGYSKSEFIHQDANSFIIQDDKEIGENALEALKKTGKTSFEARFRHHTNDIKVFSVSATVIVEDQPFIQAIIRDITRRKEYEQGLIKLNKTLEERVKKRTLELQEAQASLLHNEKLATIGKLAGSLGHELRNPLGVMNNSIFFLNLKLGEQDEVVSKHLDILKGELNKANQIISNLLNFTRLNTINIMRININRVISKIIASFSQIDNISIHQELDITDPIIKADPIYISIILNNIIENAIQSIEGSIASGGEIGIFLEKTNNMVVIKIEDNGIGIPKVHMDKIFEPFFTTKTTGIGLGLSIVKEIVEKHQGTIVVESKQVIVTIVTLHFRLIQDGV